MAKLTILVGPPGCGKSTYAKRYLAKHSIILSSDAIRKELFGCENDQEHNAQVFATLYDRMNDGLLRGNNVVIDATNIDVSTRKKVFDNLRVQDAFKRAIVIDTPYEQCLYNNSLRDRRVPNKVIKMYFEQFVEPTQSEGFDQVKHVSIRFIKSNDTKKLNII